MAAPSLGWEIAYSVGDVNATAWSKRVSHEFAASHASISLLSHPGDLTVYLVIKGRGNILVLNFGRIYLTSTYRRWGTTILAYGDRHGNGDKGLLLFFPTAAALDRFDDCCDRVVSGRMRPVLPPPSLHDLVDLGIIPMPNIIGDFMDDAATEGFTAGPHGAERRLDSAAIKDMEGDTDDVGTSVVSGDGSSVVSEDGSSVASKDRSSIVSDDRSSNVSDDRSSDVSDDASSSDDGTDEADGDSDTSSLGSSELEDMADVLADVYGEIDTFDLVVEARD